MSAVAAPLKLKAARSAKRDPLAVQLALTVLALLALGLFIVLPLVAVFVQAFAKGWVIEEVRPARFEVRPDLKDVTFSEGGPRAWFSVIRRED